MSATVTATRDSEAGSRFAWLNVVLAIWIVGGSMLAVRALNLGLTTDVGISPYHLVAYAGLAALAVLCMVLVAIAVRRGRSPRLAFPAGYGTLGLGLLALLGYVMLDAVWRAVLGVNGGVEGSFAPSRLLLVVGLALVAVGPLRAALLGLGRGTRWPAMLAAGVLAAVLAIPGGVHPAVAQWVARAPDGPFDDAEIWSMRIDGTMQTRLLDAEDYIDVNAPAVSPDGSSIAYTRWKKDGPDRWHADLWVANADGSGAHAVAEGPGWEWIPHWSPDGAWLGYTVDPDPSGAGSQAAAQPRPAPGPADPGFGVLAPPAASDASKAELWQVRVSGGAPQRVGDTPGDGRAADWSPDGSRLVFDSHRDGNTEIYGQAPDGSDVIRLTDDAAEDWAPDWSPDGTRIAFTSDRSGNEEIWVMNADGSGLTQLTDHPEADRGPSWSPDGTRIVFASWRTGESEIWSVAADGTDVLNLSRSSSTGDGDWDGGDIAPDGTIVFSRFAYAPAQDSALVREDLALLGLLINAGILSLLALLVVRIGAPFGAFGVIFGLSTLLLASQWDAWRFVPAAVVAGLLVDVALRALPRREPALVAAVGSAVAFVVAAIATVTFTAGLGWTPTLAMGAVLAAAGVGYGLALVARPWASAAEGRSAVVPAPEGP